MAKLKSHGTELYRFKAAGYELAYMSDKTVLKNYGYGWKIYAKVTSDPIQHAQKVAQSAVGKRRKYPAYSRFMDCILIYPLKLRVMLVNLLTDLPNDPDGIFSELDDAWEFRGRLTCQDCAELCRLYNQAIIEQKG